MRIRGYNRTQQMLGKLRRAVNDDGLSLEEAKADIVVRLGYSQEQAQRVINRWHEDLTQIGKVLAPGRR